MTRLAGLLLLFLLSAVGCGGNGGRLGTLAERPLQDVSDEAGKLSVSGLERRAQTYRDAIKQAEAMTQQQRETLAKMSYDERNSQKAADLNLRMQELGRTRGKLMDRYQIYIDKLHEKGVSTEAYKL